LERGIKEGMIRNSSLYRLFLGPLSPHRGRGTRENPTKLLLQSRSSRQEEETKELVSKLR
jgi:hypothetical protein